MLFRSGLRIRIHYIWTRIQHFLRDRIRKPRLKMPFFTKNYKYSLICIILTILNCSKVNVLLMKEKEIQICGQIFISADVLTELLI
jgi:hypothetical protein